MSKKTCLKYSKEEEKVWGSQRGGPDRRGRKSTVSLGAQRGGITLKKKKVGGGVTLSNLQRYDEGPDMPRKVIEFERCEGGEHSGLVTFY